MSGDGRWGGDDRRGDHRRGDDRRGGDDRWGGGPDRVEEFFAAHRAQVRDEPADDLTWQRIRDGRRRARSARTRAWWAGGVAAAAALAVVVGPSLLPDVDDRDLAGPQPSVTDPSVTGPAPTATDPSLTGPEPTATDPSLTGPEPTASDPSETVTAPVPDGAISPDARFGDISVGEADSSVRHAVVLENCSEDAFCALLARSEDSGTTWTPTADLRDLGLVHQITFTDADRGWVWGAKAPVWRTTDGGRTWTRIPLAGDAAVDLSVRDGSLLAITQSYVAQTCTGGEDCPPLEGAVVLTDPADVDWRDNVARDLGAESARVLHTTGTRYVATYSEGLGVVTSLLRVQDGQLEDTAGLTDCDPGPVAMTAATGAPEHLWALCDDEFGLALHESDNGGRAWLPTNLTVPTFVLGERAPHLVSTSAAHLLLVGEGNYAVSTDGGRTWSGEAFLPGANARPDRVEVTAGGEILAYPTDQQASGDLAFWRSVDGGATWETVPVPG